MHTCYTCIMIDLQAAGLTPTETRCYETLLSVEDYKPSELASIVHETRTNCYKILDKLVGYGLVERFKKGKILHYRAGNPTRLLELARERRIAQEHAERDLELHVQDLITDYAKTHEQPGVRYFTGRDGIKEIYADQVKVGKPIHFINTIAGIDFYSYQNMHNLRMMAVHAGIPRHALTPDTKLAHSNYKETDKKFLLERTWLAENDYTAPVEWGVYGDKTYVISFGTEAMSMTIENSQIAESFRQIFKLLDRGQRSQPWYSELPRLAQKNAIAE